MPVSISRVDHRSNRIIHLPTLKAFISAYALGVGWGLEMCITSLSPQAILKRRSDSHRAEQVAVLTELSQVEVFNNHGSRRPGVTKLSQIIDATEFTIS